MNASAWKRGWRALASGLVVVMVLWLAGPVVANDTSDGFATGGGEQGAVSVKTPGVEKIQTGTVRVNTWLNVRTGPWGTIIGKLRNDEQVKIIGREGDWLKIYWNGQLAYCHSAYVTIGGDGNNAGNGSGTTTPPANTSETEKALANWKGGRLPPAQFVKLLGPVCRAVMQKTGVPASVTLAQAALETGWGKSTIGDAKNLFGIKGTGPAGSIRVPTQEYVNGRYVTIQDSFRKYHTWQESIEDHAKLLQGSRYRPAMAAKNNADEFARQLQKCGYATSPTYASTLISIMKQYNLYQFDR